MNSPLRSQPLDERRKVHRFHMPLEICVNRENDICHNPDDISVEGVCIKTSIPFNLKDFILCSFNGKKDSILNEAKFTIVGRIIWKKQLDESLFIYGTKFNFYDDPFSFLQKKNLLHAFDKFLETTSV